MLDDGDVLSDIAEDSGDEAEAFTEGVEEDTLVESAKQAETDAAAQATATQTAAATKAGTAEEGTGEDPVAGEEGDCPRHGGGRPEDSQGAPRPRI